MIIKILLAVVVVFVLFAVIVALQPADFRITRSAVMSTSPAAVFPHVNDLHKWEPWSPWLKLDPAARSTFDGPATGPGASMAWAGNSQVGEGSMTITESQPNDFIRFRLDFLKPFKGTNTAEFTFKPQGDQTMVTWSMSGKYNFVTKAVGLFMNCDKMIGGQFEKGLADLKTIAETEARK